MTALMHTRDPISDAVASLFVPGLGQWLQRRRAAAVYFGGDFHGAVVLGALEPELRALAWSVAIAIGVWSIVDAALAARRVRPPAI